jgi:hypothetical protein
VLDAADAVGDRPEVVTAELLLVLVAERAVVGRDDRQVVGAQAAPQVTAVVLVLAPQRRRADVLRPSKPSSPGAPRWSSRVRYRYCGQVSANTL